MSVACAIEYSFCYKNFFGLNVLAVPKSQTLIIIDKTLAVALNQLLLITVQMLNDSGMSSFRIPRYIFINIIKNLSCLISLQAGSFFC